MRVEELSSFGVPDGFISKFRSKNLSELYPPQVQAIKKGLFDSKNQVISAPTASGKTFIATLAIIKKLTEDRCKVVYLVPLVALANEKYEYYRQLFDGTKFKVAISTGDYDSKSQWLSDYDLIILTTEKCDSLMRHGSLWVADVGLIIADEIHLLQDPSRGPTLEITLTRLRGIVPHAQILALSATIRNVDELAKWLNAEAVKSDFRPVDLHEGIYLNSKLHFNDKNDIKLNEHLAPEHAILDDTIKMGKQALYFLSTRRNAESLAEKLSKLNETCLGKNNKEHLRKISDDILNALEVPTRQCKKLANCIKSGVAFHHAGLVAKQKKIIEDNFRKGIIRAITATPTLAMGVNLPAFRAIIRDIKRYYSGFGSRFIPVLEYKQFVGRAGRPDYDKYGESILLARSEDEANKLNENYILGEPEEIVSKLSLEPVLRTHTLALISSGFVNTEESLFDFFRKTFYAHQYGDTSDLNRKLLDILDMLISFQFIVKDENKLKPTMIGRRVSELYIDPLTAYRFKQRLQKAMKIKPTNLSFLHMISNTLEMMPFLSVRDSEFKDISDVLAKIRFLEEVPEEWDLGFDNFLGSVKTALMFDAWVNELTEDQMLSKFRVTPGELRVRLKNADWLLYAAHELALLLGYKKILKPIRKVRVRERYGVKEELVPLVRLKDIGRVRARRLYSHNLKTISDLRKVPLERLKSIIGPQIAISVKEQLGQKVEKAKEEKQNLLKSFDY